MAVSAVGRKASPVALVARRRSAGRRAVPGGKGFSTLFAKEMACPDEKFWNG